MRIRWTGLTGALALSSFAFARPVTAEETDSPLLQLTQSDFASSTKTGLWLIEFFSPYCGHCRKFKPTWTSLTEVKAEKSLFGFNMAQVDCIAQGDLCNDQKVEYFPNIKLYEDGVLKEVYQGDRSFEHLGGYIDNHVSEFVKRGLKLSDSPPPVDSPNPLGEVLVLNPNNFADTIAKGNIFIKFFAPWCGHCKVLKPHWIDLAARTKGLVNIAEVDCETHKSFCTKQGINGFPQLMFYQNGKQIDYSGARKADDLEKWVTKAVASASGLKGLEASELDVLIKSDSVFFLYLHTTTAPRSVHDLITTTSSILLGSPPSYQSNDPELFTRLSVDPSTTGSILLAFKDHSPTPSHSLNFSSPEVIASTTPQVLEKWFLQNRHPSTFELNSANFQSVMRPSWSDAPRVVIVPTPRAESANVETVLIEASRSYDKAGRPDKVFFVWMDSEKWGDWLSKMYGSSHIVVADHKQLVYWDEIPGGQPISLKAKDINLALDGIQYGHIGLKHSENWIERKVRSLYGVFEYVGTTLAEHWLLALVLITAAFGIALYRLQDSEEEQVVKHPLTHGSKQQSMRERPYRLSSKSGARLD